MLHSESLEELHDLLLVIKIFHSIKTKMDFKSWI